MATKLAARLAVDAPIHGCNLEIALPGLLPITVYLERHRRPGTSSPQYCYTYAGTVYGTLFESERDALIDALHRALYDAQKYGNADVWDALLPLVWRFPCPAKWALCWDTDFRPAYKPTTPQIPDPARAPKQAIAWGMDPIIVSQAKARRQVAADIRDDGDYRDRAARARRLGQERQPYAASLLDGVGLPSKRELTAREHMEIQKEVQRRCSAVRSAGLADAFGLAPSDRSPLRAVETGY